ncbi:MAG: response regulator [Anaeromyxobacter sp.]
MLGEVPGCRILVVEDEADIRELLVQLLSDYAEVECAADGAEALERLRRGPSPSVILLDLRMPRLSGEELLAALEDEPARPPVVTMSACTASRPRGATAHLHKPFALDAVLSALHRAVTGPAAQLAVVLPVVAAALAA